MTEKCRIIYRMKSPKKRSSRRPKKPKERKVTVMLPVERMPSTCQSSTTWYSDLCSRHMRWSTTLSPLRPSPSRTVTASMFQSETLTPLEKFQRPLMTNPPSAARPWPCG